MTLVVGASVGLKWVLQERDSHLAQALAGGGEALLVPDFWLNEACNVLWLQVRKGTLSADEAREGLALLRAQVEPTPTADLDLHDLALDTGWPSTTRLTARSTSPSPSRWEPEPS